jgi:hypothetical protein
MIIAGQVKLISDGISQGDLLIFRDLAFDRVGYGLFKSEIWDYYSKSEFLDEVSERLAAPPACGSYSYQVHRASPNPSNTVIWIFTENWEPAWDLDDLRQSDRLVFEMNSGDGLQFELVGAYLNPAPSFVGDQPCP